MGKSNLIVQFVRGVVVLCFLVLFSVISAHAETIYFSDNFENGLGNWVVGGSDWDLTGTDSRSATHSITDSSDGNYPVNSNATMTLIHPIDLSASTAPVLSFWHKLYMPDCTAYYDYVYVEVSTDGGLTWTQIYTNQCVNIDSWTEVRIDLSAYKASPILIQFRLREDGDGRLGDGWYLDDVKIHDFTNSPPVLSPIANQQLDEGKTLTIQVSATDIDGDLLTLSVSSLPAFGTFTDNGNGTGTIIFKPGYDAAGDYLIYVVASDGKLTDSKSFTLTVINTPIDLTTGLVAYYPFNGNANDESGNGNKGTVYGATLTTDRFGNPNSAYRFDGNDYILSDASSLPTAERTVALWFYADMVSNKPNLIGYGGSSSTPPGKSWLMGINHWGSPAYSVTSHYGTNTLQYVYPQEPVGAWIYYVITTDNSGTKIYINGEEKASNSTFINNTVVTGTDLSIGVAVNRYGQAPYTDANVGYFIGTLDDIRIYNRALSAAEIQELYGEDKNSPETTITSGPADGSCVTSASVSLSWSASDNYAGVLAYSHKMDGNAWSLFDPATSITFDTLSEGSHTFSVKAKDQAGNEDPTPAMRTFTIDSIAPAISGIQANLTLDSAIITWTTNEPASSQVEYGFSISYGYETPVSPSLETNHSVSITGLNQNATYHYRVKSRDMCGNEAVSSDLTFVTAWDITPPDTSFISGPPNNGKACESNVNLCWLGTDDFTASSDIQYSYNLDNGSWSNWSTESCHSFAGLPDGTHTVLVKAKDSSGNEDATPAALNFSVDATAPDLSNITSSPRDYNATITWNTSKPATTQVEYGETTAYGMSSLLDTAMTGTHTVTIAGLTPKMTYHYRVTSNDGCHEVASGDMTFTTTDILYPNLRVTQIDMPATVKALEQINFKWLERNDGPGSAQGNWTDKIYLSGDEVIDSQDTLFGEFTYSDGLEWETERLREVTLDMPLMPPGTYYIIVQTDANNVIVETSENDNTLVKRIDYLTVKQLTAAPDRIAISLHPDETANGEIELVNLGETALTGITAVIEGNSSNISIQVAPPSSINGKTVQKISYSVSASDDSVKNSSPVLVFSSSEGQTASVTFSITVNPGYPNLVSNPGYLETTMVRGSQTIVEFEVTNTGAAAASNVKIVLPVTDWLSLMTPDSLASLGPAEKMKVGLALKPDASLALGPYTGSLALNADNATATVGFRFTAVSDRVGALKITATDEFTYFADDHPPVAGASVKIKNPFDGTMVAEGQTDVNGQFIKDDLFEGFYSIEVSAEKHGTYNAVVRIDAGQIRDITAFLPRQLMTYTWKVVPVETEDRYVVTLEAVFETHVPAPVITVEPTILDLSKLQYNAEGKATVDYTVTNHGLIAANSASIHFGTHPAYQITPLNENLGEIPAMSSVVVPATVQKIGPSTLPCGVSVCVKYGYVCINDRWVKTCVSAITGECPPTNTPGVGGGVIMGGREKPSTPGGGIEWEDLFGIGVVYADVISPSSIQESKPCKAGPLPCVDGTSCDDGKFCTADACVNGFCTNQPDDSIVPPQNSANDCLKEICQTGTVTSIPDDAEIPSTLCKKCQGGNQVNRDECSPCNTPGFSCDGSGWCVPNEEICSKLRVVHHKPRRLNCDQVVAGSCGVYYTFDVSVVSSCGPINQGQYLSESVKSDFGCVVYPIDPQIDDCPDSSQGCIDHYSLCLRKPFIINGSCQETWTQKISVGNCTITKQIVFIITGNGETCVGDIRIIQ